MVAEIVVTVEEVGAAVAVAVVVVVVAAEETSMADVAVEPSLAAEEDAVEEVVDAVVLQASMGNWTFHIVLTLFFFFCFVLGHL